MAGKFGNKNAVGNSGGKSLQDRKLAAKVRRLTLKKIEKLLETKEAKMDEETRNLYRAVFIRLAGSILPRLNEHTGDEGEPIRINTITDEQAERILKRRIRMMQSRGKIINLNIFLNS